MHQIRVGSRASKQVSHLHIRRPPLIALLTAWASTSNRGTLGTSPAITHDGANDDLWGGTGDDDFCWETADILDDFPGTTPPDYNAQNMGADERFGPT